MPRLNRYATLKRFAIRQRTQLSDCAHLGFMTSLVQDSPDTLEIVEQGVLNRGDAAGPRAVSTFPSACLLSDGTLLACYRAGSAKDCDDATIEIRHSVDNGRTWSAPKAPLATKYEGRRGSLWLAYATQLADNHLLLAAMWVDREAFSGCPLFNSETEGCLPTKILLADSFDQGKSWSAWRELPVPDDIGPPSLTNPILRFPCGRLAASIETNKHYLDRSDWRQRVVYLCSDDNGRTWSRPTIVSEDPSRRIFDWDQRAAVASDGSLVSFTWTYDRCERRYLNIHRRISVDKGHSWTAPEDLGFGDQASHPAVLSDGRIVLAWVDRFQTHSIRARLAERIDGRFAASSEQVLYEHGRAFGSTDRNGVHTTGELLDEMSVWNYGLPFAARCADDSVLVLLYAPSRAGTQILWFRLKP
jgi:hypothetical protein